MLVATLLMVIDEYSIGGYWWLLIGVNLMAIGGYFINGYYIINYCWLLYYILQLLVIILF